MRDYSLSELRKINESYLGMIRSPNLVVESSDNGYGTSLYEMWMDGDDRGYSCLTVQDVLQEFASDLNSGKKRKGYTLIPAAQYLNALRKFVKEGPELFDFPDSILDEWLYIIFMNASYLDVMTDLAGHSRMFPHYEVEDFFENWDSGIEDWSDYNEVSEYLDGLGFYDWSVLPDGSYPWSDYGLKPLYGIMRSVPANASPSEKLIAINRCLDVVHCRGDLSSAFIEGGKTTCSKISN